MRRLPDANVAMLKHAGLLKVLQPRRFGGHELSLHAHVDTVAAVAKGCGSTAWCMGVVHAHSWLMGSFPPAAQEETYGADPDTFISAVIAPRGTAKPAEGGYVLNGFWPFASGCQHSAWLLLGARIFDADGAVVDEADLLVPTAEVTIHDDWNVVGLRGTGSCSVIAKDVFVPRHRYLSLPELIGGQVPGAALHDGPLYKSAAVPVLALALTPAAVGIAEAALDAFTGGCPAGSSPIPTTRSRSRARRRIASSPTPRRASVRRRLLLHRCVDDIEAAAARGAMMAFARSRPRAHGLRPCGAAMPRSRGDAVSRLRRLGHRRGQSGAARLARSPRHQHAWRVGARDQSGNVRPHPPGARAEHDVDLSAGGNRNGFSAWRCG